MQRTRTKITAAGLLSLALVAAACGGDDGDSSSATSEGGAATSAPFTTDAGGATATTAAGPAPASLADWEALWTKQRDAVVKRIADNKWGKSADGKTLTGPEGWTVDLSKCAVGWSDIEGVSDTTIKVGQSISQSGTYADYGNLGKAIDFLFGYYGDQGLFKDTTKNVTRKVQYIQKDDGYDAARAIPNVDEFMDSDKVFAVWTLGSPATLKTYDKTNQRCVPQPLSMTAHPAWGDPVNHPWTTGAPLPTYATEALLWTTFIEQRINEFPAGEKIKVAALVQNNDYGKSYDQSFKAAVANSSMLKDRVEYFNETIEASAPTVTDPMTTLAAEQPDVWLSMLAGTQCTQIVSEAAQNGMHEQAKYMFMPQGCAGTTFISKEKLGGDGSAGEGWWVLNPGVKDTKDPAYKNDPYVVWLRDAMKAKGLDVDASVNYSSGINYGFPVVQALAIAGQLPGGLSRSNFMLALRSIDMTSPMLLPSIGLHMNGLKDPYIVEGGIFQRWNAAKQTYENQGNVINLDGKQSVCAWDQATSVCK